MNLIGWRTVWGVQLFSGKRKANVVPGSSLDRITWPHHFTKLFELFQEHHFAFPYSNRTKTHKDIGQTNKYSKQIDKKTDHVHVFATKLHFIVYGKHILHLSLTDSLHTLKWALMLLALLRIFYLRFTSWPWVYIIFLIIQRPVINYSLHNLKDYFKSNKYNVNQLFDVS